MACRFISLVVLAATLAASLGAAQAFDRRLRIKNDTGKPIVALSAVSPKTGWSGQILGGLPPGQATMASIDDGSGECSYDFIAKLADGSTRKLSGVNVCDLSVFVVQ